MQIVVNGEPRDVAPDASVADVLEALGLRARPVAVELNLEVVPRGEHAGHRLAAGDRLEVVTLVGGG